MQAILLVTVFFCLLAAANAAILGATCTPTDGTQADCADANAICPSTGTAVCTCKTGYTAYGTTCAANGAIGGACLSTTPACTGDTLVCDSSVCKKKAGQTCAAATECVSSSTCSTTCNCNSGYTALTTGLCTSGAAGEACKADGSCADSTLVCESSVCKIKAGQTCTSGSTNCVSQSTCVTGTLKCTCGTGYTALTTGLCSGVAPQSVSSWLLTGSIITLLVTFSLP